MLCVFVIQMSGVRYFTPNMDTHPEFKEALKEAAEAGVHVVAYDCSVREDEIRIQDPVPVILENPELYELSQVLVPWYQKHEEIFHGVTPQTHIESGFQK